MADADPNLLPLVMPLVMPLVSTIRAVTEPLEMIANAESKSAPFQWLPSWETGMPD